MTMTPEESLDKMNLAASNFYDEAIRTDCHAFIEFTGLIREYIKICEENHAKGIDFREENAHTGNSQLKIEPYEIDYLNEKLHCIFQGLIVVEGAKRDEPKRNTKRTAKETFYNKRVDC
ncbi:hypothetical protein [Microcoleus sp. K4-B3]|uniref:hypothetical protein n=1 Tax=Microcoleus sp. K4-B3 TaxID=2818791 RepID=UPI002FD70170